ncbi:hypothetical protein C7B67_09325 [filamentous cyanobacterium Phorm 6]|nr:hypothetical protein C7B67_09325 [filamentous cyanobacterium Phorm 6]
MSISYRCPIPNFQFPIPNSQFPIPNSQFPIPNSLPLDRYPILADCESSNKNRNLSVLRKSQ